MEQTSKIEKININCATKIEQLNQMYDLLNAFKDKYGEYKRMTPTEEKVFSTLYELCDKEELDIVESQKKLQEFFKDKLGKYWKMRISVCHNDNEYKQEYITVKNWWSSGRYSTWTKSNNMWKVGCFHGTGKELIE